MASVKGRPVMGEIEIDNLGVWFLDQEQRPAVGAWVGGCVLEVSGRQASLLVSSNI